MCSIHPYFTFTAPKEKITPIINEFVEKTKNESKCLYFAWSFNGNEMSVREGYENGEGILEHFGNVGDLIEKLLGSDVTLTRIELHGPAEELVKLEEPLAHLNPIFFKTEYGF